MAETKKYVRIIRNVSEYGNKNDRIFPALGTWEDSYIIGSSDGVLYVRKKDAELIVTEKRPAKVGERVLIRNAVPMGKQAYEAGDIFDVAIADDPIPGGVKVVGLPSFIAFREYEVIVNNEVKNEEADEMKIDLNAMGDRELYAHGETVMEAIKKRMFQAGFRSAKQAQRKLAKMNAEKSAQARRDEIVEQAKADIENLKYLTFYGELRYLYRSFVCNIEFVINKKKRTVVALLKSVGRGSVKSKGIAKTTPSDCFNVHIGKAIALRRALGLAVPDEYLNAPQPTDIRVGDVVRSTVDKSKHYVISEGEKAWCDGAAGLSSMVAKYGRIVDDSREEVGE
ncbi:hypothetical protein [Bacillus velezensis]|uniref:hypothetical protein n=1 Tax=Bacillus velezensis TaxID=492670 RepID=UPI002E24E425|nr:hypothetical protein [Bacillus velezensis]